MAYLCTHGYILGNCDTCAEFQDELEFMIEELDDSEHDEYLYDHYLDLDERALREEEAE